MPLGLLLTKQGGVLPAFSYCPLANTSICDASTNNANLVVALYNPLARPRYELVRIPTKAGSAVVTAADGTVIPSQVVLLPKDNPARTAQSLPNEIRFTARVEGLGINTYFVTQSSAERETVPSVNEQQHPRHPIMEKIVAAAEEETVVPSMSRHRHPMHPLSVTKKKQASVSSSVSAPSATPTSISNSFWKLDFDSNGLLYQVTDITTGTVTPFKQNFYWYHSYQGDGQHSGAYIFRPADPNDPATPVSTSATITTIAGPVTTEIQQTFTPWLTQVIRLHNNSMAIEFEYTVGPIPVYPDNQGKEIISRYSTNIANNATWYTDSNGRKFQKRIRNYRPTWTWNPTQPVAGNYYPVNAATYLSSPTQALGILNDRSQGGSSLHDGELELMVHRRLTVDDGRG